MRHTSPYKILALLLLASVCFGQGFIQTPPPYWYVVAPPGALVTRPVTCTQNFHVFICNGAGCGTNGEYHYCTAPNTWTVASGAFISGSGTLNTIPKFTAGTILGDSALIDDGTNVYDTAARNYGLGTFSRTGNTTPQKKLVVWGGSGTIADPATLGAESLTNPNLTAGTSWTRTGDIALAVNAATFTWATGAGTLSQALGTLAISGKVAQWYKFTYTVSAVTAVGAACSVTNAFADTTMAVALDMTAGVGRVLYFKSAAVPGAFTLSCTAASGGFTLDTFSLMEVQGGDLNLSGSLFARNLTTLAAVNAEIFYISSASGALQFIAGDLAFRALPTTGGNLTLWNTTQSNFGRISLGGMTLDFPALKRSGTTLQARLADDSAYASFTLRSINNTAQTEGGCGTQTDFVVDAVLNTKITSASYTFVAADVGGIFRVTGGAGWTVGDYTIAIVAAGAATLVSSPAAVGTAGGQGNYNRGRVVMTQGGALVADTYRICQKSVLDAYGWTALF